MEKSVHLIYPEDEPRATQPGSVIRTACTLMDYIDSDGQMGFDWQGLDADVEPLTCQECKAIATIKKGARA